VSLNNLGVPINVFGANYQCILVSNSYTSKLFWRRFQS